MILSGEKQNLCPHPGKNVKLLPDEDNQQKQACFGQNPFQSKIDETKNHENKTYQEIE